MRAGEIILLALVGGVAVVSVVSMLALLDADAVLHSYQTPTEQRRPMMQTLTASWLHKAPGDESPTTVTVTTERNVGESVGSWNARHDEAVEARRKSQPPNC